MKLLKICFLFFLIGCAAPCWSQASTTITYPVRGSTSKVWILQCYGLGPHAQSSSTSFDLPSSYIENLEKLLKHHWHPYDGAEQHVLLTVNLILRQTGEIGDVRILNSSGIERLDKSLKEVIAKLRCVKPLPEGVPDLDLQLTFECTTKLNLHEELSVAATQNVKKSYAE